MNSALILHDKEVGRSGPEIEYDFNEQWYGPVSQAILDQTGVQTAIPELPHPSEACFADYAKIIDSYKIDEGSTVVGHGFGAGILLRYLSDRKDIEPSRVALVAPRYLPFGQEGERFFRDRPDTSLAQRVGELSLLYSDDTSANGIMSARIVEQSVRGVSVYELQGYGKCIVGNSMKRPEFPALLHAIGVTADETSYGQAENVVSIRRAESAPRALQVVRNRLDRVAQLA